MASKCYEPDWIKSNDRVTLKIDVSHVDHSYIIGRGGQQIQSIMNSTNCHIHFPDGNKSRTSEKSNQVTISGLAANAERARQMVRQCLLVNISFDIPITGETILLIDNSHPTLQFIQKKFNVCISFKYRQEIGDFANPIATASVKGLKTKFNELKEAMLAFWIHLTGSEKGFNGVYMKITIEIAIQNQRFVQGKGNCNIKTINSQTGAVVIFPNIIPSTDSGLERINCSSTVEVRGKGMDSVFLGWLHMLGFLPMVMIFDIQPDMELDSKLMTNLMANLPLNISIRYKNRTSLKKILLKCCEKNSNILLEAYAQLISNQLKQSPQTSQTQYSIGPKLSNYEECLNRSFGNMEMETSRSEQLTHHSPYKYDLKNKPTSFSFSTSPADTSRSLTRYGGENMWTSQLSSGFEDDLRALDLQPYDKGFRIWSNAALPSSVTNSMFEDSKKEVEDQNNILQKYDLWSNQKS